MANMRKFYLPYEKDELFTCVTALTLLGYEWDVKATKCDAPPGQYVPAGETPMMGVVSWGPD